VFFTEFHQNIQNKQKQLTIQGIHHGIILAKLADIDKQSIFDFKQQILVMFLELGVEVFQEIF
jgi:hypothetical protein